MVNVYILKTIKDAIKYINLVNSDSKKRILDYQDKMKQNQMISAELLLYYALAEHNVKTPKIVYKPKPTLINSDFYISKAHSDDYVMVAVSNYDVGCDIEKFRTVKNHEKILSALELNYYQSRQNSLKPACFVMFWTVKEAFVKYHGRLIKPYNQISFQIKHENEKFVAGLVDDLFAYYGSFDQYGFAVVTKSLLAPNIVFINENNLNLETDV